MKIKFLIAFCLAVTLNALADGPITQVSPFMKPVLESQNSADAQSKLGFTGTTTLTTISNTAVLAVQGISQTNEYVTNSTFAGDGRNITAITPGNISAGTAGINISGNAATATAATTATGATGAINAGVATNVAAGLSITNPIVYNGILSNSTFAGNGFGLTNVLDANSANFLSLSNSSLPDNSTWVHVRAGQMASFQNMGQNFFPNLRRRLLNGPANNTNQIVVEMDGTGFMGGWMYSDLMTNILNNYPFAGGSDSMGTFPYFGTYSQIFGTQITCYPPQNQATNVNFVFAPASYGQWFFGYQDMTNLDVTKPSSLVITSDFPWNRIIISALCTPYGSSFTLYTNSAVNTPTWTSGGPLLTFSTLTTANGFYETNFAANLAAGTVPTLFGAYQALLKQTSLGTNRIILVTLVNTNVAGGNGLVFDEQANSSSHIYQELMTSNCFLTNFYCFYNPTVIFYDSPETSDTYNSNAPVWFSMYRQWCPNADISVAGMCPISLDGSGNSADSFVQDPVIQSNCANFAMSYFDWHGFLESTNNLIFRGWWGDGTHPQTFSGGWDGFSAGCYGWYQMTPFAQQATNTMY